MGTKMKNRILEKQNKITLQTVSSFVKARKKFNANGSLFGNNHWDEKFGQLPKNYWSDIELDSKEDDFYVVTSYYTPIAWFADGMWYVPNVRYSTTTTKHLHSTRIPCRYGLTGESDKWVKIEGQ